VDREVEIARVDVGQCVVEDAAGQGKKVLPEGQAAADEILP
jgi:hypothetical protein